MIIKFKIKIILQNLPNNAFLRNPEMSSAHKSKTAAFQKSIFPKRVVLG